jgi:predicted XRE-type DNA-binding protein
MKTQPKRQRPVKVQEGSGNVFADIGMPNPEEARAKAEIALRVTDMIAKRGLTQLEAGHLLNISQPRVSDLARGRLVKFSLDTLLTFARQVGLHVEIRMSTSRKPGLTVNAA